MKIRIKGKRLISEALLSEISLKDALANKDVKNYYLKALTTNSTSTKKDLKKAADIIMKDPDGGGFEENMWYMKEISKHPNVDTETLTSIINFYYGSDYEKYGWWADVIATVASNPKVDPDLLDYMADTQDIKVRDAVAQNPSTPSNTLKMLARGGDPASVAARKRASLEEIIRKTGKKYCLYSKSKGKDGKRRKLGCYPSRAGAKKREKQVQYFKHKG